MTTSQLLQQPLEALSSNFKKFREDCHSLFETSPYSSMKSNSNILKQALATPFEMQAQRQLKRLLDEKQQALASKQSSPVDPNLSLQVAFIQTVTHALCLFRFHSYWLTALRKFSLNSSEQNLRKLLIEFIKNTESIFCDLPTNLEPNLLKELNSLNATKKPSASHNDPFLNFLSNLKSYVINFFSALINLEKKSTDTVAKTHADTYQELIKASSATLLKEIGQNIEKRQQSFNERLVPSEPKNPESTTLQTLCASLTDPLNLGDTPFSEYIQFLLTGVQQNIVCTVDDLHTTATHRFNQAQLKAQQEQRKQALAKQRSQQQQTPEYCLSDLQKKSENFLQALAFYLGIPLEELQAAQQNLSDTLAGISINLQPPSLTEQTKPAPNAIPLAPQLTLQQSESAYALVAMFKLLHQTIDAWRNTIVTSAFGDLHNAKAYNRITFLQKLSNDLEEKSLAAPMKRHLTELKNLILNHTPNYYAPQLTPENNTIAGHLGAVTKRLDELETIQANFQKLQKTVIAMKTPSQWTDEKNVLAEAQASCQTLCTTLNHLFNSLPRGRPTFASKPQPLKPLRKKQMTRIDQASALPTTVGQGFSQLGHEMKETWHLLCAELPNRPPLLNRFDKISEFLSDFSKLCREDWKAPTILPQFKLAFQARFLAAPAPLTQTPVQALKHTYISQFSDFFKDKVSETTQRLIKTFLDTEFDALEQTAPPTSSQSPVLPREAMSWNNPLQPEDPAGFKTYKGVPAPKTTSLKRDLDELIKHIYLTHALLQQHQHTRLRSKLLSVISYEESFITEEQSRLQALQQCLLAAEPEPLSQCAYQQFLFANKLKVAIEQVGETHLKQLTSEFHSPSTFGQLSCSFNTTFFNNWRLNPAEIACVLQLTGTDRLEKKPQQQKAKRLLTTEREKINRFIQGKAFSHQFRTINGHFPSEKERILIQDKTMTLAEAQHTLDTALKHGQPLSEQDFKALTEEVFASFENARQWHVYAEMQHGGRGFFQTDLNDLLNTLEKQLGDQVTQTTRSYESDQAFKDLYASEQANVTDLLFPYL